MPHRVKWIADCAECHPYGHLVMSFDNQDEREAWAVQHERRLKHKVYRYLRHFPVEDDDAE